MRAPTVADAAARAEVELADGTRGFLVYWPSHTPPRKRSGRRRGVESRATAKVQGWDGRYRRARPADVRLVAP